jgi:uncharacterized protein
MIYMHLFNLIQKSFSYIFIATIKLYQLTLRPFIGWHCRFTPRCSDYAIKSIQVHGCIKGGYFTMHRLCRCHPYANGGIDEVPAKKD